MSPFSISNEPLSIDHVRSYALDPQAGAYVSFEGWVRNHHLGKDVLSLEYEAYAPLAQKEGARIIAEAMEKFSLTRCCAVHRVGQLAIGEIAVVVGVSAAHRDAAFAACRFVIDEIKERVPIWKKETYMCGESAWVLCQHHHAACDESRSSESVIGFT